MQIAQKLYEGIDIGGETTGLITYMRTDGVRWRRKPSRRRARAIGKEFGERYLPEKPRIYTDQGQERAGSARGHPPDRFVPRARKVREVSRCRPASLYDLIWKRTIASQMRRPRSSAPPPRSRQWPARPLGCAPSARSSVSTASSPPIPISAKDDDRGGRGFRRLPRDQCRRHSWPSEKINATQHFTEPPPRYSEASLIKKMEELGIGRPSTYASTLKTLRDREYVKHRQAQADPDSKGRIVTAFLESFFNRYVEYDFTADLEEKLDEISDGKLNWKDVLRDFWKDFSAAIDDIKELRVTDVLDALNEALAPLALPGAGRWLRSAHLPEMRHGTCRSSSANSAPSSAAPTIRNAATPSVGRGQAAKTVKAGRLATNRRLLGKDPFTGEEITLRSAAVSDPTSSAATARKPSVLHCRRAGRRQHRPRKGAGAALPARDIGAHPETGKMISAGLGRYGPFVLHDGTYANLENVEDVFSIGLEPCRDGSCRQARQGSGSRPHGHASGTEDAWQSSGGRPADHRP
jgi:DNA topoisomerase-1